MHFSSAPQLPRAMNSATMPSVMVGSSGSVPGLTTAASIIDTGGPESFPPLMAASVLPAPASSSFGARLPALGMPASLRGESQGSPSSSQSQSVSQAPASQSESPMWT